MNIIRFVSDSTTQLTTISKKASNSIRPNLNE